MARHLSDTLMALSRPLLVAPHPAWNGPLRVGLQPVQLNSASSVRLCSTQAVAVGVSTNSKTPVSVPLPGTATEPDWTPRPPIAGRPLSTLPHRALLRSLLITTVSSKPLLLTPTLKLLSFLVKSRSKFLLNVDRNPVLYTVLRKTFYDHFCAGETADETRECVKNLRAMGMRGVILTYAKETHFDHLDQLPSGQASSHDKAIEDWRLGVMNTMGMVGPGDYLAIKYVTHSRPSPLRQDDVTRRADCDTPS